MKMNCLASFFYYVNTLIEIFFTQVPLTHCLTLTLIHPIERVCQFQSNIDSVQRTCVVTYFLSIKKFNHTVYDNNSTMDTKKYRHLINKIELNLVCFLFFILFTNICFHFRILNVQKIFMLTLFMRLWTFMNRFWDIWIKCSAFPGNKVMNFNNV